MPTAKIERTLKQRASGEAPGTPAGGRDRAGGRTRTDAEQRQQVLEWFSARCIWLPDGARIPQELAEGVIRASAWWPDHPQGPVEAPGDAKHLTWGTYGWRIYESNSFEISLFVEKARPLIRAAYKGTIEGHRIPRDSLCRAIASQGMSCVSDYLDALYDTYGQSDWLAFGSHAIDTLAAADHLIEKSGYDAAVNYTPRQRQPEQGVQTPTARTTPRKQPSQQGSEQSPKKHRRSRGATPEELEWAGQRLGELRRRLGGLSPFQRKDLRALLIQLAPLELAGDLNPEQNQQRQRLKLAIVSYVDAIRAKREGADADAQ